MKIEKPPYTIAPDILFRIEEIGEAIGRATGIVQDLRLRRINRILTVRGSLAIEGNVLSEEQVSTILDGKPVVAPLRDIQEARNAIKPTINTSSGTRLAKPTCCVLTKS